MTIILPNWGAELGQSLAQMGNAVADIIDPNRELKKQIKIKLATDLKFGEQLRNNVVAHPGELTRLGLPEVEQRLRELGPTPEFQWEQENYIREKQEAKQDRETERKIQTTRLEALTTQLLEMKDFPEAAALPAIAKKIANAQELTATEMDIYARALKNNVGGKIIGDYQQSTFRLMQLEREDKREERQAKAQADRERRVDTKEEEMSRRRFEAAGIEEFERTRAGSPAAWTQYYSNPLARARAGALFENPELAQTADQKDLLEVERRIRGDKQTAKNFEALKFGHAAMQMLTLARKENISSDERSGYINQMNQNLLARAQVTGEQTIQAYWDAPWLGSNGIRFRRVSDGKKLTEEEMSAIVNSPVNVVPKDKDKDNKPKFDVNDPKVAERINVARVDYGLAEDKEAYLLGLEEKYGSTGIWMANEIRKSAGLPVKADTTSVRTDTTTTAAPATTPVAPDTGNITLGSTDSAAAPSTPPAASKAPPVQVTPVDTERPPKAIWNDSPDDMAAEILESKEVTSNPQDIKNIEQDAQLAKEGVVVNHVPTEIKADTAEVTPVSVPATPLPNPVKYSPQQQAVLKDSGVTDTSRVFTSKENGYKVYDTTRVWKDGKTSKHRLDFPSGRKKGETWEQYEDRVLEAPVTKYSKYLKTDNRIESLEAEVQPKVKELIALAASNGIRLGINETRRAAERQELIFKLGRSLPGPVRTWTLTSDHMTGRAVDFRVIASNPKLAKKGYEWLHANAQKLGFILVPGDDGHVAYPAVRLSKK